MKRPPQGEVVVSFVLADGGFAQQEPIKKLIALTKPHPDLF